MTGPSALIDTNVLVYAFDSGSGRKHPVAKDLLGNVWTGKERVAVSTQNLAEFSVIVREKVENPLPASEVMAFLSLVIRSRNWQVVGYQGTTIIRAHEISDAYHLHFWDSLLVATMEENALRTIITEDMHFKKVPGISMRNPFT